MNLNEEFEVFIYSCEMFRLIYVINTVTEIKNCKIKIKRKQFCKRAKQTKKQISFKKLYLKKKQTQNKEQKEQQQQKKTSFLFFSHIFSLYFLILNFLPVIYPNERYSWIWKKKKNSKAAEK